VTVTDHRIAELEAEVARLHAEISQERADVVAYLRAPSLDRACCKERTALEADCIERGEHVGFSKKEKP